MSDNFSERERALLRRLQPAAHMSMAEAIAMYKKTHDVLEESEYGYLATALYLARRSDLFKQAYLLFLRDGDASTKVVYLARDRHSSYTELIDHPGTGESKKLSYFRDLGEIVSARIIMAPAETMPMPWRNIYFEVSPENLPELKKYLAADDMEAEPYPRDLIMVRGKYIS